MQATLPVPGPRGVIDTITPNAYRMLQLHMPRRFGTGLFIVLAHLVLIAALLHHANRPRFEDTGPVEYMSYIVVPKPAAPRVEERAAPVTPPPVRRSRPPVIRAEAEPAMTIVPATESAAMQLSPEAAAPSASPSPKLDMVALRADARRAGKDYAPEPFEQVRAAESRLEAEKKDLGRAIANTKRPPCTKKYSGGEKLNLIALIPLAIDTITDTGCKW